MYMYNEDFNICIMKKNWVYFHWYGIVIRFNDPTVSSGIYPLLTHLKEFEVEKRILLFMLKTT